MLKIRSLFAKVFGALVNKVATEPVFLATLTIASLNAFNQAQSQGLVPEDAVLYAASVLIGLLARQLVWPAIKVDAAGAALPEPEPPLEQPFLGETEHS